MSLHLTSDSSVPKVHGRPSAAADDISIHTGNGGVDRLTLTRNAESSSIVAGRQSHDALKDLSE